MFNILIVEDNAIQLEYLKQIVLKCTPHSRITAVRHYEDAVQAIQMSDFNLFILDINLNGGKLSQTIDASDGIGLGFLIRSKEIYSRTPIIFITAFSDKVMTALNQLHCFSYLVKPYAEHDVKSAVSLALDIHHAKEIPLELKDANGIYFKLYQSEIIYIQLSVHDIMIQTKTIRYTVKDYMIREQRSKLVSSLIRCHKSFYVNPEQIRSYDKTNQVLSLLYYDQQIPVGRKYKDTLFQDIVIASKMK